MDDFWGFFIKIGQYEHIKALQSEGIVHCKPVQYFAKLKDEQFRGDELENVSELRYGENVKIHFFPIGENASKDPVVLENVTFRAKTEITGHCGNLFCLYAINIVDYPLHKPIDFSIDCDLGTHALVIQSAKFFEKIDCWLDGLEIYYERGLVKYKDFSKYTGSKTFFEKDLKFKDQKRV